MRKEPNPLTPSVEDTRLACATESGASRFERPSIEEISLCCEIAAYAPVDDDRPLF